MSQPLRIVILGLSITSSWGNGHATTYRALIRELVARGHDVLFLERDTAWYAAHRDLPVPPSGRVELYSDPPDLRRRFGAAVHEADLVIVGSYVPDGVAIGEWVTRVAGGLSAFYDIDTPVTLAKLASGDYEYLSPELIPRYDLYLSFTGGPTLERLERVYGAVEARALYCSVDPTLYHPEPVFPRHDLGYMGTYSPDRQAGLETLLLRTATEAPDRAFVVAGPQYPSSIQWPSNVARIEHLPPDQHRRFYAGQRFTLNLTRAAMVSAGYSPSVRLFEAAACGTPIISDYWAGLDTVLTPGREILVATSTKEVLEFLRELDDSERQALGLRAQRRVLAEHTAAHRAAELEGHALRLLAREPAA
ncbi:MAG TPA: glycosyltransferase [Gemmatimonadales bacterium]|nr:glycosyltransferase [Gemmatimonadales bacterium]